MPFEQALENGLLLRTARDEKDIQHYITFNTVYNNVNEGLNTNILMHYFPGGSLDDYQLVEDTQTGEMVATTCLIPWEFDFEGIRLRAGQLEQVLSHPGYRRHGLVRTQMKRFMQTVEERGLDFSFIWGIPYYYRQYGYSYAIEGNTYESLPSYRIPDAPAGQTSAFCLRDANLADAPLLAELYHEAMRSVPLHITRSEAHWLYLLEHAHFPVQIVEDAGTHQPMGYIGLVKQGGSLNLVESGITNQEVGWAVLRALKAQATGAGEIQVPWPHSSTLARLAQGLGSTPVVAGQWLFHITDMAAFLRKIAPVFERRLASSDCAGLTRNLVINLFRQAYRLSLHAGKVADVKALGFVDSSMGADGGDLCIPPDAFVRLLLGYCDLDVLYDAWPDIVMKPESRRLVDVLFPRLDGYFYATYACFG
jgi:hypothetical protein